MSNDTVNLAQGLNNILQFLNDSALCFKKHVSNVAHQKLKETFEHIYQSRLKMLNEIKAELNQLGEDVTVKGTVMGKLHMVFENIKSAMTHGSPLAITKEVRRGENILIDYYKIVLAKELPASLRQKLLSHLKIIQYDINYCDLLSIGDGTPSV